MGAPVAPIKHCSAAYSGLPGMAGSAPGNTTGDQVRFMALALRRRCYLCGCLIPRSSPVYNAFSYGDGLNVEKWPGGVYTTQIMTHGGHKSCIIYAALVCPFLKYRQSRQYVRGERVPRGAAEIIGFNKFGIAFFTETALLGASDPHGWAYIDIAEQIPYETAPKDLPSIYREAVNSEAKVIDKSSRLCWTDSAFDRLRLLECSRVDQVVLATMRTQARTVVGGHTYRLALL